MTINSATLNSSFSGQTTFTPLSLGSVPAVVTLGDVTCVSTTTAQNKMLGLAGTTAGNSVTGSVTSGNTSDTLGIVKSGTSTWTLSGNLGYGGLTQVTGGVLTIAPDVGTQAIASTPALSNTTATDGADIQGGTLIFDYSHGQTTPVSVLRG